MWYFLVMVHGTSSQQILWCEFKTLGFTFAHGFIKIPKIVKRTKKIKYRGNFQESFEILSLENPFWLPRWVFRNFQGK